MGMLSVKSFSQKTEKKREHVPGKDVSSDSEAGGFILIFRGLPLLFLSLI